jgi:hypothetical protein
LRNPRRISTRTESDFPEETRMRVHARAFAAAAGLVAAVLLYGPASAQDASLPVPADAYADEAARELVRQARIRRGMVDGRIEAYETRAQERFSASMGTPLGERLLFRRETVSQVSWTRDTVRIQVLAAREVLPPFSSRLQVPGDLSMYMPAIAFDPVDSEMLLRLDETTLRHPLSADSEHHYRFAAGDTTVIRLPDGRTVRLHELRITPRRADPTLIAGSFWVEAATHAVVQAYFRPARGYDSRRDRDATRVGPSARGQLDYIAIDYGFWDLRWWLPHTVAAGGVFEVAGMRMPISFERRYGAYAVVGDTISLPTLDQQPEEIPARPCRPRFGMMIQARTGPAAVDTMSAVSVAAAEARQDSARRERRAAAAGDTATVCEREFIVTRAGSSALLASELLPHDIFDGSSPVLSDDELRAIAERMGAIPHPPWQVARAVLEWPLNAPHLVRYNRVEGLSPGVRATVDFGRLSADAGLRAGTAAGEVGAELGLVRTGERAAARIAAYRRLDAVAVASSPFGVQSTLANLLLGQDDNDYFRASGAELRLRPPHARTQWYDLRFFAERQQAVSAHADFSVLGLVDSGRALRPNIAADAADQAGATLRLRTFGGLNPDALRWGGELELHGEAGDFTFARPALRLRAAVPLLPRVSLGTELAGGGSFGEMPAQRLWQLGGVSTLRGYDGGVARGNTYWRGRAELGVGLTFARVMGFADAGWAGTRSDARRGRALTSAGLGLSMLDGLVRFDLARATHTGAWKIHMHFNSVL